MLVVRAAPHGLRLAISRRQAFPPSILARRSFRVASAHQQGESSNDAAAQPPAAAEPPDRERAVAPRSMHGFTSLSPSWGRMSQMVQEMEREMAAMSRAFGMPPLFTDLPSVSAPPADMPALSRALAVDIKDAGDSLVIAADVPGLSKEDVKVEVSPDRVLSISGERKTEVKEGSQEEGNLRVERSYGSFVRRFRLPESADVEGIKASVKNGELTLVVPKKPEAEPKKIEVNVSE